MIIHQQYWGKSNMLPCCDNLLCGNTENGLLQINWLIHTNIYSTKDWIWFIDAAEYDMSICISEIDVFLPHLSCTIRLRSKSVFMLFGFNSRIKTRLASPRVKNKAFVCHIYLSVRRAPPALHHCLTLTINPVYPAERFYCNWNTGLTAVSRLKTSSTGLTL